MDKHDIPPKWIVRHSRRAQPNTNGCGEGGWSVHRAKRVDRTPDLKTDWSIGQNIAYTQYYLGYNDLYLAGEINHIRALPQERTAGPTIDLLAQKIPGYFIIYP